LRISSMFLDSLFVVTIQTLTPTLSRRERALL
jgi:hypothetical protein